MILHVFVELHDIFKQGSDYPWKRPAVCPGCNCHKVWGHGFVVAYFDGYADALHIRRYRCPDCKCVIRLRPGGFFNRFQASIATIRSSVSHHLHNGNWLPDISRTRQAHWYRALRRRVLAYFGSFSKTRPDEAFDWLVARGVTPVSRSI